MDQIQPVIPSPTELSFSGTELVKQMMASRPIDSSESQNKPALRDLGRRCSQKIFCFEQNLRRLARAFV